MVLCTMVVFPILAQEKQYNWVKVTSNKTGKTIVVDNGVKELLLDENNAPIKYVSRHDKVIEIMERRGYEFVQAVSIVTLHWLLMKKEIKLKDDEEE